MVIIGQNLGEPFPSRGLHRYAIGQTVTLVGPRSIKAEAGQECLPALGNNPNLKVVDQFRDDAAGSLPDAGPGSRKERQIFRKDLLCRDDRIGLKQTADFNGAEMCRIVDAGQGSPIKRIGENVFQSVLFGRP